MQTQIKSVKVKNVISDSVALISFSQRKIKVSSKKIKFATWNSSEAFQSQIEKNVVILES